MLLSFQSTLAFFPCDSALIAVFGNTITNIDTTTVRLRRIEIGRYDRQYSIHSYFYAVIKVYILLGYHLHQILLVVVSIRMFISVDL
jgi:hypothetical protein